MTILSADVPNVKQTEYHDLQSQKAGSNAARAAFLSASLMMCYAPAETHTAARAVGIGVALGESAARIASIAVASMCQLRER